MNQSTVKWSTWSNDSSRKNPISVIFLYIESFAFPSKWKWKWKREILACLWPVRAFICLCLERHLNGREWKWKWKWNTYSWTSLVLFQVDIWRYLLMAKQDKSLACRQFIIRSMYVTPKTTTKDKQQNNIYQSPVWRERDWADRRLLAVWQSIILWHDWLKNGLQSLFVQLQKLTELVEGIQNQSVLVIDDNHGRTVNQSFSHKYNFIAKFWKSHFSFFYFWIFIRNPTNNRTYAKTWCLPHLIVSFLIKKCRSVFEVVLRIKSCDRIFMLSHTLLQRVWLLFIDFKPNS